MSINNLVPFKLRFSLRNIQNFVINKCTQVHTFFLALLYKELKIEISVYNNAFTLSYNYKIVAIFKTTTNIQLYS